MQENTIKKILIGILSAALVIGIALADALIIEPDRIVIRYETIADEKIPEALNDMTICFFTDLDYGLYTDEDRMDEIVSLINSTGSDVVIFGGDLYDDSVMPDETGNAVLTEKLKNITAQYGKFAVYGDHDDSSEELLANTDGIYAGSDFEVIHNTSITLHKKGSAGITFVGLGNGITGRSDVESAYANVSANNLVFTVCHTPDSADTVPADLTDYMAAGHSHGGQVYWYFGALDTPDMAVNYLNGIHSVKDAFTLDISSGASCTIANVRFMTSNEIVVYRFVHQEPVQTES
ncbi:MAG: metallophosphoesterase [Bulleidia sp.]